MSIDSISGNESTTNDSYVDNNSYDNVDVNKADAGDVNNHINTIKELSSPAEITDYIKKNIIDAFKAKNPPDLAGSDRTITSLIASLGQDNPELGAIVYHAADSLVKLGLEGEDSEGKRKIILGNSGKSISDDFFNELAKASNDKETYANNYFNKTPTSSSETSDSNSAPETNQSPPANEPYTKPYTKDVSDKKNPPEPNVTVSDTIANLLPDDALLSDFDKELIIDTKTGKKVNPKKYDLDNPDEAEEYQKILDRSITIYTDKHGEAIADDENIAKISSALLDYITKPYETDISADGLSDILDNFNEDILTEIFNPIQEAILSSGDQANIKKLKNFKDKAGESGLDGNIGDIVEYNYFGGNTGDPRLFLSDIFENDPTLKLESVSIDKISDTLAEHLNEYLNTPESKQDKHSLNFISQAISLLASNPDNVDSGNINTLLKQIIEKAGDNPEVKELVSDIALNAGYNNYSDRLINDNTVYIDKIDAGTLTAEEAKTFLDSFTTQEKANPEFWNDIFADQTFATEDEYNKFRDSILKIFEELGASDTDPAVKTAFTTALLDNKPELSYENAPKDFDNYLELLGIFIDGKDQDATRKEDDLRLKALDLNLVISDPDYNKFLVRSENTFGVDTKILIDKIKEGLGNDDTAISAFDANLGITKQDLGLDTLESLLSKNNNDVIKALEENNLKLNLNGNKAETFASISNLFVNYVVNDYKDGDQTDKLIELIDEIAKKIGYHEGYVGDARTDDNKETAKKQVTLFVEELGKQINSLDTSNLIDIGKIKDHIAHEQIFAENNKGIKRNKNNTRVNIAEAFEKATDGTAETETSE